MRLLLILSLLALGLFAKPPKSPQEIYQKKCAMCHNDYGPETYEELKAMVAPPITIAMKNVTIGTDAIEEPQTKEQLRELTIAFIKDYVMHPSKDKAYCEEIVFKQYNMMPSLQGFITKEQLDKVIPYVYDTYAPKKTEE